MGDIHVTQHPTNYFRVLSKNTGTINLINQDMIAITQELLRLDASVFAAQETNVHWDPATHYQLYTQCRTHQLPIYLATSCSQEPSPEWYKPGGTLLMAIGPCTIRILKQSHDKLLGRWSFIKLAGQNHKRLIIVTAYRVCNQQFDAASNTSTAQQI